MGSFTNMNSGYDARKLNPKTHGSLDQRNGNVVAEEDDDDTREMPPLLPLTPADVVHLKSSLHSKRHEAVWDPVLCGIHPGFMAPKARMDYERLVQEYRESLGSRNGTVKYNEGHSEPFNEIDKTNMPLYNNRHIDSSKNGCIVNGDEAVQVSPTLHSDSVDLTADDTIIDLSAKSVMKKQEQNCEVGTAPHLQPPDVGSEKSVEHQKTFAPFIPKAEISHQYHHLTENYQRYISSHNNDGSQFVNDIPRNGVIISPGFSHHEDLARLNGTHSEHHNRNDYLEHCKRRNSSHVECGQLSPGIPHEKCTSKTRDMQRSPKSTSKGSVSKQTIVDQHTDFQRDQWDKQIAEMMRVAQHHRQGSSISPVVNHRLQNVNHPVNNQQILFKPRGLHPSQVVGGIRHHQHVNNMMPYPSQHHRRPSDYHKERPSDHHKDKPHRPTAWQCVSDDGSVYIAVDSVKHQDMHHHHRPYPIPENNIPQMFKGPKLPFYNPERIQESLLRGMWESSWQNAKYKRQY